MEFDNAFEVPLEPNAAWRVLMDIERIAPCMPGAQLTEKVDDRSYKGKVAIRLGPVALSFAGLAKFEEIDDAARTARVSANGTDTKGRGGAASTVLFRIVPAEAGSKVLVHTDLTMSGSVAQYGRGVGMIQQVAAQLINQFAAALAKMIEAEPPPAVAAFMAAPPSSVEPARSSPPPRPATPAAKPISGLSLMAKVLWTYLRSLFRSKPPAV